MEMANQMLSEIKAANKRKTLDGSITPSTSSNVLSKPARLSKHEDNLLVEQLSQVSINQQNTLSTPQKQQKQQIPPSSQHNVAPVGQHKSSPPPMLPPHTQPYIPHQYPVVNIDPRYQQQHQGPYHTPAVADTVNYRPAHIMPPSQIETIPRVQYTIIIMHNQLILLTLTV